MDLILWYLFFFNEKINCKDRIYSKKTEDFKEFFLQICTKYNHKT